MRLLQQAYQSARYSPLLCQLVVTRRCNLTCTYCSEYDRDSDPVETDLLRQRIDKIASLGSLGLELTGGEPLLHPQLLDLVRHAATKRFRMLGLITNGYLLSDKVIEGLNEAGLTEMQISVDGVEPRDTTVKVLRPLRKKLERVARLARFKVVVSGVVGAGASPHEVEEVIRFAKAQGFRPRILLIHDSDGQLVLGPEELRVFREAKQLIGWHYRDLFDYRETLITRGEAPFRCRAGSRYLYIDETGTVRWCAQTYDDFGKSLTEYTLKDLKQQFYAFKRCNPRCTLGCARSCSMLDRWFPQPR